MIYLTVKHCKTVNDCIYIADAGKGVDGGVPPNIFGAPDATITVPSTEDAETVDA